jgi:sporulation protein YlmC with PRC-barrel domain
MKKNLFMTLLAIVIILPAGVIFAQAKNSPVQTNMAGNTPEGEHINAFRIDNIIDSAVINLDGKRIGTINDLVIDIDTGNIMYAVLEFGGFMGFGDKLFAVPWQSLTAVPVEGIFILDQSEAKLKKSPGFDKDNWPDIGDRNWGNGIYEFYRHHPPRPRIAATPATPHKRMAARTYRPYPGYETEMNTYPSTWQNLYGELFDTKKIETVTGKIVKIKYGEMENLIIYTDAKKPVMIALGPTGYFEGQAKALKPGNRVTVTGSMVVVDDTPILIATKIKEGNEELLLRDNEGHPIWLGWQQIK